MIKYTLANSLNYATTFLFQIFLAFRFGADKDLSILIILIGISTSVIGIFANTSQVALLPSISDGGLTRTIALRKMWALTLLGNLINLIVIFFLNRLDVLPFELDVNKILFYLVFSSLQLFALQLITLHLSNKSIASALISPSIPSFLGTLTCAFTASIHWIMFGLIIGTLLQIIYLAISIGEPQSERIPNSRQSPSSMSLILNLTQYTFISISSVMQKICLQNYSFEALSTFNYADRIANNAQATTLNGITSGLFSEWSQPKSDFRNLARKKSQIIQVFKILFLVVMSISIFSDELVALCFQRGKFDQDLTLQVSQLLVQMQILVLVQAVATIWANMMYATSRIMAPSFFGILQMSLTIILIGMNWGKLSPFNLVEILIIINVLMTVFKLLFSHNFYSHRVESRFFHWYSKISMLYLLATSLSIAILTSISTQLRLVFFLVLILIYFFKMKSKSNYIERIN